MSGTGAKALPFTRIDAKVGTQTGIGQFTTITQAAACEIVQESLAQGLADLASGNE